MSEAVVDDIVAVLPPLLQTLHALSFIVRHLDPPEFADVVDAAGAPDEMLQAARARLTAWPEGFGEVRTALDTASEAALAACAGLRAVRNGEGDLMAAFRALRYLPRAMEALYPLAATLPPVSDYFLDASLQDDAAFKARLAASAGGHTGVFHDKNELGNRGGFSLYVPEYYAPDLAWPLVVALHGGSGNGRSFLWSWLRDARSFGAILVTPTAIGPTWALMGEDADTPNLVRILDLVRARYNIDPTRMLLTGLSDGGTFCYVSGLEHNSPFTHLAPIAATFHPLMAEVADAERLRGLPIHIVHGARDWMFPIEVARHARALLTKAGANVAYGEIDDLSHTYPREINPELLRWLNGA
ncbi:MAG: phospholipase [Bradyrhizobium sp.]|jgi:phospholipase/carboxylesterase|uniref:carboxylesterase family protein n=1 Tax=Bradyrhizobium sp. TaxID=376 RepID=UPI003C7C289C